MSLLPFAVTVSVLWVEVGKKYNNFYSWMWENIVVGGPHNIFSMGEEALLRKSLNWNFFWGNLLSLTTKLVSKWPSTYRHSEYTLRTNAYIVREMCLWLVFSKFWTNDLIIALSNNRCGVQHLLRVRVWSYKKGVWWCFGSYRVPMHTHI